MLFLLFFSTLFNKKIMLGTKNVANISEIPLQASTDKKEPDACTLIMNIISINSLKGKEITNIIIPTLYMNRLSSIKLLINLYLIGLLLKNKKLVKNTCPTTTL